MGEVGQGSRRASDADRDQAIAILNNALAIGELKSDEHEQRLQAAFDATTVEALRELTADLTPPSHRVPWWSTRRRALAAFVALAVVVVVAALVSQEPQRPVVGPSHVSRVAAPPSSELPSASGVRPSPTSASVNGIDIQVVPPGEFAQHDPADECGAFGAVYTGGGANCYLVVQFNNTSSSTVSFTPVDLRMVDQTGDTYSVQPVAPPCYDSVDVNASTTLNPQGHVTIQLCYPVMTGALPQSMEGTRSLSGLSLTVPSNSIVGIWGGA
jgi:uncharacterized protein DUF1707